MADESARMQLLDAIGAAADHVSVAIAALGEAYEELDETTADRLEEQLFRPLQSAYGRLKRTHSEFAGRHGLEVAPLQPQRPGVGGGRAKGRIDDAVEAVRAADEELAGLQDSFLPIEYGDVELRAGLTDTRAQLGDVPGRAREFVRTLGR
jgi:hypothetical protein